MNMYDWNSGKTSALEIQIWESCQSRVSIGHRRREQGPPERMCTMGKKGWRRNIQLH